MAHRMFAALSVKERGVHVRQKTSTAVVFAVMAAVTLGAPAAARETDRSSTLTTQDLVRLDEIAEAHGSKGSLPAALSSAIGLPNTPLMVTGLGRAPNHVLYLLDGETYLLAVEHSDEEGRALEVFRVDPSGALIAHALYRNGVTTILPSNSAATESAENEMSSWHDFLDAQRQ